MPGDVSPQCAVIRHEEDGKNVLQKAQPLHTSVSRLCPDNSQCFKYACATRRSVAQNPVLCQSSHEASCGDGAYERKTDRARFKFWWCHSSLELQRAILSASK